MFIEKLISVLIMIFIFYMSIQSITDFAKIDYDRLLLVLKEFDMFGQKQLVISFHRSDNFPIPNRWIRFWTKVFFNSKWDFKK